LSEQELLSAPNGESSSVMATRVRAARNRQIQRFREIGLHCNAQMGPRQLQEHCLLDSESVSHLRRSIHEFYLSARAYDRILRVARTIADLEGVERISPEHVCESIQYRGLDRRLW
jgi:magnesium chelatase family protein